MTPRGTARATGSRTYILWYVDRQIRVKAILTKHSPHKNSGQARTLPGTNDGPDAPDDAIILSKQQLG